MIDEGLLKREEKAIFSLRSLYRRYGYLPYKMSKFEEYELYVRNKDFLVSDRIITFTDTGGRLLALKPDVTLSIIKNGEDKPGCKQKLCYNENVYRVSGSTRRFKEIMQTGLECIGDIDAYDLYEALFLAAESLALISEDFVLEVSHLGILAELLDAAGGDAALRRELARCISAKNRHDLERLCRERGVGAESTAALVAVAGISGPMDRVLGRLAPLCLTDGARRALDELRQLRTLLDATPYAENIIFDFSVVNDMDYYNGLVFKGYLSGLCDSVLSGGQYDKLMRRMGRSSGAVGFALYLDLLEGLGGGERETDVDVLLLYDAGTPTARVAAAAAELTRAGLSVSAQRSVPDKLRYRQLRDLRGEEKT